MEEINERRIEKTITVNCSIHTVWWKWTTHEGLLTFFGKDNSVDLRLGGPFEIYFLMDNPLGLRGSEGCKVLSYLPERMLSFSWSAPPQYHEIRNHEHKTWVVVTFKSIDDNTTKVELSHLGWLKGDKWDTVYDYFDQAWETVFGWLEKSCNKVKEDVIK